MGGGGRASERACTGGRSSFGWGGVGGRGRRIYIYIYIYILFFGQTAVWEQTAGWEHALEPLKLLRDMGWGPWGPWAMGAWHAWYLVRQGHEGPCGHGMVWQGHDGGQGHGGHGSHAGHGPWGMACLVPWVAVGAMKGMASPGTMAGRSGRGEQGQRSGRACTGALLRSVAGDRAMGAWACLVPGARRSLGAWGSWGPWGSWGLAGAGGERRGSEGAAMHCTGALKTQLWAMDSTGAERAVHRSP